MIKARKSLGQNFLVDVRVARRIVDAVSPLPTDIIIEIGPGTGALTRMLIDRSGYVVAVELDRRLIDELRSSLKSEKLNLIEADALQISWSELAASAVRHVETPSDPRVRVVANLPFYISTPILERLIRDRRAIHDMTLMLQNEVVDRITSGPGRKEYGYLSVLVQYYCASAKLFEIPPSAFKPAPKVSSAIVRLVVRDRPLVRVDDEGRFFALVKAAFAQRRKTIANNLKPMAGEMVSSTSIAAALDKAKVDPRRRAETLSVEEFAALYSALYMN